MKHRKLRLASFAAIAAVASLGVASVGSAAIGTGAASVSDADMMLAANVGRKVDNPGSLQAARLQEAEFAAFDAAEARVMYRPTVHAGRHTDNVWRWRTREQAEFAAFDREATEGAVREPVVFSGRRIDHLHR